MDTWLLLISLSPMYTLAVSGIATEYACHQLAIDITNVERSTGDTLRHSCISYNGETVLTKPMIKPDEQ